MKTIYKTILTLAIIGIASVSQATVITVSNNPITAGQYTNLQTAINASTNGDTIYVHGSPTSYGDITVDKKLCFIGAGYAVTGTQNNVSSYLGNIYLSNNVVFVTNAASSSFIGLDIYNLNAGGTNYASIYVSRCRFTYMSIYNNGWIVENCIFYEITLQYSPVSNCLIRNNFVVNSGYISGASSSYNQSGLIVDHNVIDGLLYNFSNAIFSNNVFFYSNISAWSSVNNCTFTNNITASSISNTLPYGTNSGGGNMNNVSFAALFVGVMSTPQGYPAMLSLDWHLKTTCVGHNGGSDGADVGMYGGTYAMPNLTGASSIIPQMTLMNINNVSIPVNGTLNVRFKAKKQN